jgi:hypothetical protein
MSEIINYEYLLELIKNDNYHFIKSYLDKLNSNNIFVRINNKLSIVELCLAHNKYNLLFILTKQYDLNKSVLEIGLDIGDINYLLFLINVKKYYVSKHLFLIACKRTNIKIIKELSNYVDITDLSDTVKYYNLLHLGADEHNIEIVKLGLEKKIFIDSFNERNINALHIACYKSNNEIIKYLLENGADINLKCYTNFSSVMHVAMNNHYINTVTLLLEYGAKINEINSKSETPLVQYLLKNLHNININFVKFMLNSGAILDNQIYYKIIKHDFYSVELIFLLLIYGIHIDNDIYTYVNFSNPQLLKDISWYKNDTSGDIILKNINSKIIINNLWINNNNNNCLIDEIIRSKYFVY